MIKKMAKYDIYSVKTGKRIPYYPESRSNAYLSKEQLEHREMHGDPLSAVTAGYAMQNDQNRKSKHKK